MIRVLIADDQAVVRSGLRMILGSQPDLEVVAEACDGEEAVQLTAEIAPDVVLMDIRMPALDGIEATRRIVTASAGPRVLILTTYGVDENVYDALGAGASGFLVKTDSPDHLVRAVRAVAEGDVALGAQVTERLIEQILAAARPGGARTAEIDRLTGREREVLQLVATGRSNAEIATELFVSEATVKTHMSRILAKLDCRDRVQAVVFAYECGLVRPASRGG